MDQNRKHAGEGVSGHTQTLYQSKNLTATLEPLLIFQHHNPILTSTKHIMTIDFEIGEKFWSDCAEAEWSVNFRQRC